MSREIKFRAWDGYKNKMVNDYFVMSSEGFALETSYGEITATLIDWKLMQYTGLKDKEGKEIYEGDIVEERWDNPLTSKENVDRYKIGFAENGVYKMYHSSGEERFHRTLFLRYQHVEVVGNTFQNPELLEQ